jgi:hypothetical protein
MTGISPRLRSAVESDLLALTNSLEDFKGSLLCPAPLPGADADYVWAVLDKLYSIQSLIAEIKRT